MKAIQIGIGTKFNKLTITRELEAKKESSGESRRMVECLCDCGNKTTTRLGSVRCGNTKSCGCIVGGSKPIHGMAGTRLYNLWDTIIQRTKNPNHKSYGDYGGRGITVCEKWRNFVGFWEDMGEGYIGGLTIDRIDNNKGYFKDNCRWATMAEQNRNKRTNIVIKFRGEEKLLIEWSEDLGINYRTLWNRIVRHGWPIERALTESVRTYPSSPKIL